VPESRPQPHTLSNQASVLSCTTRKIGTIHTGEIGNGLGIRIPMRIRLSRFFSMALLSLHLLRGCLAGRTRFHFLHQFWKEKPGFQKVFQSEMTKAAPTSRITRSMAIHQRGISSTKNTKPSLFGVDKENRPRAVFLYDGGCGV